MDAEVTTRSSDFGVRHYQAVSERLGLTVTRLPSDTTFRRILQKLDFQALAQQFGQWARLLISNPKSGSRLMAHCIKGTVSESQTAYQNFVNLVSVYSTY